MSLGAMSKCLSERINWIISRIPSDLFFILCEPTSQDQLTYFTGRSPFIGKVSKRRVLFVINRLLLLTTLTLVNGKLKRMKKMFQLSGFILWFKSFKVHSFTLFEKKLLLLLRPLKT